MPAHRDNRLALLAMSAPPAWANLKTRSEQGGFFTNSSVDNFTFDLSVVRWDTFRASAYRRHYRSLSAGGCVLKSGATSYRARDRAVLRAWSMRTLATVMRRSAQAWWAGPTRSGWLR